MRDPLTQEVLDHILKTYDSGGDYESFIIEIVDETLSKFKALTHADRTKQIQERDYVK